ncbi:RNA polymerase sigma factor [Sphingomonas sp. G124]|uniref:RNA polymerase sigma factor n=1 Tax=Sphingomonas cremea TaxID=2904799 RepID=A0A9X1QKB8_9SPHN|nr:RNA polymerase sigma factor [Sphingomonas cremea]MCF2515206.1 RNA polymerase sigma factor [Sphingomonas cremea]
MSLESHQGLVGLLEERRAELRRFLVARTGSEADADDLLSELWIKVNTGQPGPIASPTAYLFRMANNLVLDRIREARRRERRESEWTADRHGLHSTLMEVSDSSPNAEQLMVESGEARRLADAIAQLPAGAQRVLRRHKLDGLSHGEVAAELGISKSAVEKHMAVAMNHLRRLLGD